MTAPFDMLNGYVRFWLLHVSLLIARQVRNECDIFPGKGSRILTFSDMD
jgi:hypothetical protein